MKIALVLVTAGGLLLSSCASSIDSNTYERRDAGLAGRAQPAMVVTVREVQVEGSDKVGTLAGAAIGGVSGSFGRLAGDGVGVLGAVAGAIVGGLVGRQVERAVTEDSGYEYVIDVNGKLITVVQDDEQPLQPGQPVLLIRSDRARIVPVDPAVLDRRQTDGRRGFGTGTVEPDLPAPVLDDDGSTLSAVTAS